MGIATYPVASGGGIKSVQRGQAVSAGSITITAVDIAKTFVRSFSEGAAGTVAASGQVSSFSISNPAANISNPAANISNPSASLSGNQTELFARSFSAGTQGYATNAEPQNAQYRFTMNGNIGSSTSTLSSMTSALSSHTSNAAAANLSGGSTNLTSASYGVYLSNSTTLVATGPCRWEVVEFN
jgi:hypothetical protein